MKYTFVNEKGQQKTVEVPEDIIKQHKRDLNLTTNEAIQLYLFDKGYISNPIAEELTAKAKGAGAGAKADAKPRKQVKRKEDPTKRAIIETIYQFMMKGGVDQKLMFGKTCAPIEITNPERIIAFQIGDDRYELTLSKKRK